MTEVQSHNPGFGRRQRLVNEPPHIAKRLISFQGIVNFAPVGARNIEHHRIVRRLRL